MFEVKNVHQLDSVLSKMKGGVRHPGRQASPLIVLAFQLHGFTAVYRVHDVNEPAIHLAPGDLLLADQEIESRAAQAHIKLAQNALAGVVELCFAVYPVGVQTLGVLPLVNAVIEHMRHAFNVEAFGKVVVGFKLEQVLHLGEAEVLVACPDDAVIIQHDVGPVPVETPERESGHRALDRLADVFADRVESGHRAVEL